MYLRYKIAHFDLNQLWSHYPGHEYGDDQLGRHGGIVLEPPAYPPTRAPKFNPPFTSLTTKFLHYLYEMYYLSSTKVN